MISIGEVLKIYKQEQVDDFFKTHTGYNLNERGLTYEKISNNWSFVGNNPSSASVINMLEEPKNGSIETTGTATSNVLPPISRFDVDNTRLTKKSY